MIVKFSYSFLLAFTIGTTNAQNFEPKTGDLNTVNKTFHEDYNQLVRYHTNQLGDSTHPVMIMTGDSLVFKYKNKRETSRIIPLAYHQLKAIDHLVLGIFTLVSPWPEGKIADSNKVKLKAHEALCSKVQEELKIYSFPETVLKRQEKILIQAREYLQALLKQGTYFQADRNAFARSSKQLLLDNTDEAARLEISSLHAQVSIWVKRLDSAAFNRLCVVIGSSHQARYRELTVQYFDKLLSEKSDGSALSENRLVFAESVFNEAGCLSMLARHIIDQEIGLAFFGDRYRMQRDLLSDAATKYLQAIFPPDKK